MRQCILIWAHVDTNIWSKRPRLSGWAYQCGRQVPVQCISPDQSCWTSRLVGVLGEWLRYRQSLVVEPCFRCARGCGTWPDPWVGLSKPGGAGDDSALGCEHAGDKCQCQICHCSRPLPTQCPMQTTLDLGLHECELLLEIERVSSYVVRNFGAACDMQGL